MSHRLRQALGRRGFQAAAGALVAGGVLASVGAAGAAQQAQEKVIRIGSDDGSFSPTLVEINTGDTITWDFTAAVQAHNAAEDEREPQPDADPTWQGYKTKFSFEQVKTSRTFNYAGEYKFYCQAHDYMKGTIKVTGDPVEETPTPTPTETATPTPTPTPAPTVSPSGNPPVDDHTTTPAPAVDASADRAAPAISAVRLKGARRTAKVTFRLSESATVTLRFSKRGSGKVLRTVRLQARAGTRTVKVHSALLKRGRYTVELQARDALGNRSPALRSSLRITRK